MEQKKKEAGL